MECWKGVALMYLLPKMINLAFDFFFIIEIFFLSVCFGKLLYKGDLNFLFICQNQRKTNYDDLIYIWNYKRPLMNLWYRPEFIALLHQ